MHEECDLAPWSLVLAVVDFCEIGTSRFQRAYLGREPNSRRFGIFKGPGDRMFDCIT